MKQYRLLKDLPYAKAGEVFERVTYKSKDGLSDYDYLKISKREKDGEDETSFTIDYNYFLDNFDEWFEEITDSIHWKPKNGDEYWYTDDCGGIYRDRWDDESIHVWRYLLGLIKHTKEECEKARERELAEVRLRKTSDFETDFKNGKGGWIVGYDHEEDRLLATPIDYIDYGEPIRYATEEEAKRSIRENRGEWLKYFGIEEEE